MKSLGCLERTLENYLRQEKMTGDNKYACPKCIETNNEKQDAKRGTKFVKLPKILQLQLVRFTLDMQTFNRKKLNDQCTFPLYLNMNHFLDKDTQEDEEKLKKMIEQNPLLDVAKYMAKPKPFR